MKTKQIDRSFHSFLVNDLEKAINLPSSLQLSVWLSEEGIVYRLLTEILYLS